MLMAYDIFFIRLEFRQFMSIGSLTTSDRLFFMNWTHSKTKLCIPRKSELINIEITFFKSSFGSALSFKYLINHSNIFMSQCTEMSMSSSDYASCKYCSKYFIWLSSKIFSHLKSLLTFLFSSNTCITISSSEDRPFPLFYGPD